MNLKSPNESHADYRKRMREDYWATWDERLFHLSDSERIESRIEALEDSVDEILARLNTEIIEGKPDIGVKVCTEIKKERSTKATTSKKGRPKKDG